MTAHYMDLLFSPAARRQQELSGSRASYARIAHGDSSDPDRLGAKEIAFIGGRDSFYLASVGQAGWPYVQHRGGPPGFLKVLDDATLAFADYRGNRQYVTLGNLESDDRVSLFLMDYVRRARLKLLGRMRPVDLADEPALAARLIDEWYGASTERGFVIAVEAFDWNCPQHITPRYTQADIAEIVSPLRTRIAELEARLEAGPQAAVP